MINKRISFFWSIVIILSLSILLADYTLLRSRLTVYEIQNYQLRNLRDSSSKDKHSGIPNESFIVSGYKIKYVVDGNGYPSWIHNDLYRVSSSSENLIAKDFDTNDMKEPAYIIAANNDKLFLCFKPFNLGTDPGYCHPKIYTISTKKSEDLTMTIGGIDDENPKSIQFSPDNTKMLITNERDLFLVDLNSFRVKNIYQTASRPFLLILGTYSDFPSFEPQTEWVDNHTIRFNLYKELDSYSIELNGNEVIPQPVKIGQIKV